MNKFYNQGYLIKKKFLETNDKKKIISLLKQNFFKKIPYLINNKNLESQIPQNQLIKLRKKKKIFGEIYDKINLSSELRSIFYQKKFLDIFKSILKSDQIYLNGFMFRFDFPNDKRNRLSWHQDSPYYLQTYPKFKAGVCWIPVTKNSELNGTLQFIPQSNKKFVKSSFFSNNNLATSEYKIDINKNELKKVKNLNQEFGDVSFLHMNLKHSSGFNISNKVRMTIACRFHCMKNMNVGKEIFFFNDKKIRVQDKYIVKKK